MLRRCAKIGCKRSNQPAGDGGAPESELGVTETLRTVLAVLLQGFGRIISGFSGHPADNQLYSEISSTVLYIPGILLYTGIYSRPSLIEGLNVAT